MAPKVAKKKATSSTAPAKRGRPKGPAVATSRKTSTTSSLLSNGNARPEPKPRKTFNSSMTVPFEFPTSFAETESHPASKKAPAKPKSASETHTQEYSDYEESHSNLDYDMADESLSPTHEAFYPFPLPPSLAEEAELPSSMRIDPPIFTIEPPTPAKLQNGLQRNDSGNSQAEVEGEVGSGKHAPISPSKLSARERLAAAEKELEEVTTQGSGTLKDIKKETNGQTKKESKAEPGQSRPEAPSQPQPPVESSLLPEPQHDPTAVFETESQLTTNPPSSSPGPADMDLEDDESVPPASENRNSSQLSSLPPSSPTVKDQRYRIPALDQSKERKISSEMEALIERQMQQDKATPLNHSSPPQPGLRVASSGDASDRSNHDSVSNPAPEAKRARSHSASSDEMDPDFWDVNKRASAAKMEKYRRRNALRDWDRECDVLLGFERAQQDREKSDWQNQKSIRVRAAEKKELDREKGIFVDDDRDDGYGSRKGGRDGNNGHIRKAGRGRGSMNKSFVGSGRGDSPPRIPVSATPNHFGPPRVSYQSAPAAPAAPPVPPQFNFNDSNLSNALADLTRQFSTDDAKAKLAALQAQFNSQPELFSSLLPKSAPANSGTPYGENRSHDDPHARRPDYSHPIQAPQAPYYSQPPPLPSSSEGYQPTDAYARISGYNEKPPLPPQASTSLHDPYARPTPDPRSSREPHRRPADYGSGSSFNSQDPYARSRSPNGIQLDINPNSYGAPHSYPGPPPSQPYPIPGSPPNQYPASIPQPSESYRGFPNTYDRPPPQAHDPYARVTPGPPPGPLPAAPKQGGWSQAARDAYARDPYSNRDSGPPPRFGSGYDAYSGPPPDPPRAHAGPPPTVTGYGGVHRVDRSEAPRYEGRGGYGGRKGGQQQSRTKRMM